MEIFDFNGRLFPVKTYKHIYEQLSQHKERLLYHCVAETPEGERIQFYQPLSDEDVCALLNDDDACSPVERIDWTETKERFAREKGVKVEIGFVSSSPYLKFVCHLVDEQMISIPYSVLVSVDDYVGLTDCVDTYFMNDVRCLEDCRIDLYKLLLDSKCLPRPLTQTTRLLLTSAEEIAYSCHEEVTAAWGAEDEICHTNHGNDNSSHLEMKVEDGGIEFSTYELEHHDILDTGKLTIDNPAKFRQCVGAYYPYSLIHAVETMYGGLDADLKHIAEFCDKNEIAYTWDK